MKGLYLLASLLSATYIIASPLHQYMIESRKAQSVATLLEKFSPCQLTIISNQINGLRIITAIKMPIQIFLLPFEHGKSSKPSLPISVRQLRNLTSYTVFYGQQYIVKTWTPVCKLNAISYESMFGRLEFEGSFYFAEFFSTLGPVGIPFSNHLKSRSVFEFESTYYFFIFQNRGFGSTAQVLETLSTKQMDTHKFWTLTIVPPDAGYVNEQIYLPLWFVTLVQTNIVAGHSAVHLVDFHVRFQNDRMIENWSDDGGNIMDLIKLNIKKSSRNFKYRFPETLPRELVRLINSKLLSSPLEYLKFNFLQILSTSEIVFALSVSDANLSFEHSESFIKEAKKNLAFCRHGLFHETMNNRDLNFPFPFQLDDGLFSFVTCSGTEDETYSFKILLSPFLWPIWFCILGLAGLILAVMTMLVRPKFHSSMVAYHGISLLFGGLGAGILDMNGLKPRKIKILLLLWTAVGILVGNLYQGRLTETLIFPRQYESNLTLEGMVRRNFTLLLIPEATLQTQVFENAIKNNVIDSLFWDYSKGLTTKFFRRMVRSFVFKFKTGKSYNDLVKNVCKQKLKNCETWKTIFAAKPYIPRIPELLKSSVNSNMLLKELSRCAANSAFIHDRKEMMKIFKPKLPKVVYSYRREFKFVPLANNIVDGIEIFACKGNFGNAVHPYIKKYLESGLSDMWERFAGILKFRWTSMKKSENVNIVTLDGKFVAVILTFSAAYAFYIIVFGAEIFQCKKNVNNSYWFQQFLLFCSQMYSSCAHFFKNSID